MILHAYHCSHAVIEDYRSSHGRNRPDGTGRFPAHAGEADVRYEPPTHAFGDELLGRLLELFQDVAVLDSPDSPIRLNWQYLEGRLGLTRRDVRELLGKARALGLMQSLTIAYDYRRWLQHSHEKGCLVVMTCVEASDLERSPAECSRAYCDAVDAIVENVLNPQQTLTDVFVVPNGHLAPRAGNGLAWERSLGVLQTLPPALSARGYRASLNSYGYSKMIQLAINAHKLGYLLRVV